MILSIEYRFLPPVTVSSSLIGYVVNGIDLQYQDTILVLCFQLATTELLHKDGKNAEHAEWHIIVMWGAMAEAAAEVLRQGKLTFLEGKLRTWSFKDSSGIKQHMTEIVATHFALLGGQVILIAGMLSELWIHSNYVTFVLS